MSRLKTLIVGCGNIAGGFDAGRTGVAGFPLTHAGAYAADGRFELSACVEPDDAKRENFMRAWKVPEGFRSIDEVAKRQRRFDVISVCSPTERHADDLEVCIELKPRVIFCEKPVTTSALRTARLIERCKAEKVSLAVNYTRRWDPVVSEFADGVCAGRWGTLRSVVGFYNKGLLNNGSHLLDLLHLILGSLELVEAGQALVDYHPEDPSVPAWLRDATHCPIQLVCGNALDFALFELQFIFSEAVVCMENGGMFWRERVPVDSHEFKGFRVLSEGSRKPGGYSKAMLRACDNIFEFVSQGNPLASTGETAFVSQQLCELIRSHDHPR
jgi:predicted dehydrogenase